MKIRVLAVAVVMSACSPQSSTYSSSSGSLALSKDDALLYAVDSDSNSLFVLDTRDESVVAQVAVGKQPEKVVVGPDDTIYVSNRMSRSVSVIRRGEWKEASHLATAVEPTGMAFTSDGKTLLVVNATSLTDSTTGTLMGFDTSSQQQVFEVAVGNEPRSVAVHGNKAFISLYKQGDIATLDLSTNTLVSPSTQVIEKVNLTANGIAPNGTTGNGGFNGPTPGGFVGQLSTVHPLAMEALAMMPDGTQVFSAALLSSDQVLPSSPGDSTNDNGGFIGSSGGSGYSGSSCGGGSVVSPVILTFDGEGASQAQDTTVCGIPSNAPAGQPVQALVSPISSMPIQGPSAIAVDPTGTFVYVVGRSSNNVMIVPTSPAIDAPTADNNTALGGASSGTGLDDTVNGSSGVPGQNGTVVEVGAGPSGIALSHDGKTAWVLNAFDHSVSRIGRADATAPLGVTHTAAFTADTLPGDVVAGRKLFFSAVDSRMTSPTTSIACASCHNEGREDGHVWNFTDGPRQTPSLAGRKTSQTLPLHWNGQFDGMTSFMAQTVNNRMGGTGVTDAMEAQISKFIDSQVLPDNPYVQSQPTAAQMRGAQVFAQAGCGTCHLGQAMTDNGFHDVGSFAAAKTLTPSMLVIPADDSEGGLNYGPGGTEALNTPSLIGLARTAPYLHDGSAPTLMARVSVDEGGKHGTTAALTQAQLSDLVEFLQTL